MINSKQLKEEYANWISNEFEYKELAKTTIRIDTPFFDRHNDSLILYALIENDTIKLTDGGYVVDDLESSGVHIFKSKSRTKIFESQLSSYGVKLNNQDNDLFVLTNLKGFPEAKHRLLQAMLFTNDMFMLNKKNTSHVFFDDVADFLEDNNIRAFQNALFTGSGGMSHKFEFSIPGIKNIPDKLIKTLNLPNNETYAKALTADVNYTSGVLKRPTQFYAFINDTEKDIKSDIKSLLNFENINIIPFSKRNDYIKELSS